MDYEQKIITEIAALNDEFRNSPFKPELGKIYCTPGVAGLTDKDKAEVFKCLRAYDNFTYESDPYGWHEFGCIEIEGIEKIFWKIDIFEDETLSCGAEFPNDRKYSYRVLTLMLASEY
ncbi:hypothetical protein NBRC116494_06820 [Aurantivibrio plasticivorans]